MTEALGAAGKAPALRFSLLVLASLAVLCGCAAAARAATPGGVTAGDSSEQAAGPTSPAERALLFHGRAIAPLDAPPAVRQVIAAANRIRTKPYIWGGGHGRWWDRGYDCSGSVSFALHGGDLISTPMPSGSLEGWGRPGPGRWITVYANAGHAYAVIAGLRWDTAGNLHGTGPRWHRSLAAAASGHFVARHPVGY